MNFYGTIGNDKHSYGTDALISHRAYGYEGNDNLSIFGTIANQNTLLGGDGNDKLFINANDNMEGNSIDGGAGKNDIRLGRMLDVYETTIQENSIAGGDDGNKVSIKMASKALAHAITENYVFLGSGKNKVELSIQGADDDDDLVIDSNTIFTGNSDDVISLKVKAADDSRAEIDANFIKTSGGRNKIQLIGDAQNDAVIDSNSVIMGDGSDTLKIVGKSKVEEVTIDSNAFYAAGDNDKVDFLAITKEDEINFDSNLADLGSGDDRLALKFSVAGDEQIRIHDSTLLGGEGEDMIDFRLKNKENISLYDLSIDTGSEDDQVKINIKSEMITFYEGNNIQLGDGDDRLDINGSTGDYFSLRESTLDGGLGGDIINFKAKVGDDFEVYDSKISAGDSSDMANNKINFLASSKNDVSISDTLFESGNGDDQIKIDLKGLMINFTSDINAGKGDDDVSLKLNPKNGDSTIEDTSIDVSTGTDTVSINAKGNYSKVYLDMVTLGNGDDQFTIKQVAKQGSRTRVDNLDGGAGDDLVQISSGASDGTRMTSSNISTSIGNDIIDISLISKSGAPYVAALFIDAGGDDDVFSLEMTSKDDVYRGDLRNSQFDGGDGDDYLSLDLAFSVNSYTGYDVMDVAINGDADDDKIVLDMDFDLDGLDIQAFLSLGDNTISGGSGTDELIIKSKGQSIDLTGDPAGYHIDTLEIFNLGKKNELKIDGEQIISMTDNSNDLFITGKGSDVELSGGVWLDNGIVEVNGENWQEFQQSVMTDTALLRIATSVDVTIAP